MSSKDYDAPPVDRILPTPDEISRAPSDTTPNDEEMDGPDDLELDELEVTRAKGPTVSWPQSDEDAPDFAHLAAAGDGLPAVEKTFELRTADILRMVKANGFDPMGPDDTFVFALRGASLIDRHDNANDGMVVGVDKITLEETRPDHRNFRCVIGFCNRETGKLSAFRASTVPNVKYMTNYYLWSNGKGGNKKISANMLPTGCYVYRVGAHGGGKIYPALRLTDPQKITNDGTVCVYRTKDDLTFTTEDVFHACMPYDNIHCAYSTNAFDSAGCQTVQGPNKQGPWGAFQSVLRRWKAGTRIDYVLLTGREAAISAHLGKTGKGEDGALIARLLGRLRPGSRGEAVNRLQKELGMEPSGYFGATTKVKLGEVQRSKGLASDGIWSPATESALGWAVLNPAAPKPAAPVAVPPAPAPKPSEPAGGVPVVADAVAKPTPVSTPDVIAAKPVATAAIEPPKPVPPSTSVPAVPKPTAATQPEAAAAPVVAPKPATAEPAQIAPTPTPAPATPSQAPVQVAMAEVRRQPAPELPDFDAPPRDAIFPSAEEVRRAQEADETNPEELDGPTDLPDEDETRRAGLPPVAWPQADKDAPDYAHLEPKGREPKIGDATFTIRAADIERLITANAFDPKGPDGRIVLAFRGCVLVNAKAAKGALIDVDEVELEEARPDHRNFRCVIGYYVRSTGKLSAFTASTVPNVKYMTNYYRWNNAQGGNANISANMLPTGCYVFRVGGHNSNKIKPALRMTDPDNLTSDSKACVLRTSNDLTYKHDDLFDYCMPYDNIHCAYAYDSFSSAGCQTIQGPNGEGPWGAFQAVLRRLSVNTRLDYLLLTGREASISAYLGAGGQGDDAKEIMRQLGRLRVGSLGAAVSELQSKIGVKPTGYFGPYTKKKLVEFQRSKGLRSDGIWAPDLDEAMGWSILSPKPAAAPPAAPQSAPTAPAVAAGPAGQPKPTVVTSPASAVASTTASPVAPTVAAAPAAAAGNGNAKPVVVAAADTTRSTPPAAVDQFNTVLTPATAIAPPAATQVPKPVVSAAAVTPSTPSVPTTPAAVAAQPETAAAAPPSGPVTPMPAKPAANGLEITEGGIAAFAPRAIDAYRQALLEGNDLLTRYGINQSPMRLCHFLGQIGNECGQLRILEENMTYRSAARIRAVWPTRFPTVASAEPFVNNPEGLAEQVYGGQFDNGPGDGWRYRGRGLVQITGRSNYREMGRKLGIPLEEQPELACDPKHALAIACETWVGKQLKGERDMNRLADVNKLEALTYRINGAYTNLDDRRAAFEQAWKIWGSGEPPRRMLEDDTLDRGDRAGKVDELNARLDELGLFIGLTKKPPQHVFNLATYKAVCVLQERSGLTPSGVVGGETWGALEKAIERGGTGGVLTRSRPPADRGERTIRDAILQRLGEIRSWSIGLALLAIAFVGVYIYLLTRPTGNSAIWLPLFFAGMVFVTGLALWLAAREQPDWREERTTREGTTRSRQERKPGAFVPGEEEPVRLGANLD